MKRALIICFVVFLLMQFIRPQKVKYSDDETYEIVLPSDIKEIFVRACYDCHSNKIDYPWYSNVSPFSWVVINHTNEGVNALNFSNWEKYTQTQKNEKLKAIYRTVHSSMPLPAYTLVHVEAELSKEDREKVRDWTGVRK
ncbi:heme-binding domain-containing protein [Aliarcobacter cryaerophilus]|uniref:heme-binding domain-containing protein n=1 Tax=Aliarcobacter cryaerophilus TaxID=28198 RepID=UPI0011E03B23|nr:heme-binding domain-containing protein [Aliarcobacter cryaerophilus]